jgi:hypothetical protein
MLGGEISTTAKLHPSGRWLTLDVVVAGQSRLSMVLDTGSPVSAISPRARASLAATGSLEASAGPNRYLLRRLTMAARPIPDLEVGVLARLDRLDIVGLLGLDFLGLFQDIHFNVPSLRLTLVPPGS